MEAGNDPVCRVPEFTIIRRISRRVAEKADDDDPILIYGKNRTLYFTVETTFYRRNSCLPAAPFRPRPAGYRRDRKAPGQEQILLNTVQKTPSQKTRQAEILFRASMKEHGLRCTGERLKVLHEVYRSNTHLDADEIFVRLKKKGAGISRATVYHTLDLLFRFDLVTKIDLGHKHAHYEKSYGVANHLHIICQNCGKVIEAASSDLAGVMEKLCSENGFSLGSFSLQVFGECMDRKRCGGRKNSLPA